MNVRLALSIAASVALVAPAAAAEAQSAAEMQTASATQRARARALFGEGVAFARDGVWEQAVDRFSRTMELNPSPVVAYNLASALEAVGRIVEACEHLRSIERFDNVDEVLAGEASALLATMEPRIARLVIDVDSPDATIELDGHPISSAELGVEIPIDPGTHRVAVRTVSGRTSVRSVELAEGERASVDVDPELVRAEVVAADPPAAPEPSSDPELRLDVASESSSVFETWWFWTASSAVVAGVVLAVLLLTTGGEATPVQGDLDHPVLRGVVTP